MASSLRLALARKITGELKASEGRNLVAVGVYGSVARRKERLYSDIDMLIVVRRKRPRIRTMMRDGFLVTILQETPDEARDEVQGSRPDLNDALGGWRSMRALYDPSRLLARLMSRARRPTRAQFREAAMRALLETYEDYGKLLNAIDSGDNDEAREMAIWFSAGAMSVLFDLEGHVLHTGRRAFIELRRRGRIGEAVWDLRYRERSLQELSSLARETWLDLLDRARRARISIEGLS